jgi:TP901 family phage tail tape measure protein
LNIVANAQFQQVYAEVAKLKEAMASLQKLAVGGPFAPGIASDIKASQSAFDSAILSTRAFTIQHVAMTDSVTKFGKQLESGKLSLNQYYKIWRESAAGTVKQIDALAASQARLNRSVAIADPLKPGYAKLVTDINGVVTAQEKAIFYQKALNTALHDGAMKVIDFGKNTQWMGRQLTVGLTMPLAMFGAGVSNAFLQVDKELTRMQKVYGTGLLQPTQATLKQIRSEIMALGNDLARTLGTSMQETAAMSADLAATGLQGANLVNATREAIRLATLGELDHQQAMQATVSLQNVYKLSTQGLSDAVNFLNAVENQTSTSLQDLVDAIPRVGPIVQQLGGSFKDTAAMMVAMKEAGVPAAQGANAIKSALASLINPTKNAQNAFKLYNIDLAKMTSETGGKPILMLKALADQMKNLDKLAQAQLIEKLFGKFQFARIQALLDNINKAGSQTATVFNLMGASSTELANLAANELKQQTESASGRFKRMTETIKADLLPIGQSFLNAFSRIGNVADKLLNVFKAIGHTLGPVAGLIGKIFGTGVAGLVLVGPILMLTGLFANLIGNLLKGANYIRMFKQGMDQAGASQNRFSAGIQNMRNFYENLDAGMIAARNQLELMPEAVTSNARAFDILNQSIRNLTVQFEALAVAQAASMGIPMGGMKGGQFKLPGFATGGIVPGTGNSDSYAAMLTPGEAVIPKAQTARYAPVVNAIIQGTLPGFSDGLHAAHAAPNFGPGSDQYESIMAMYPELRQFEGMTTRRGNSIVQIVSNLVNTNVQGRLNYLLRSGKATKTQFAEMFGGGNELGFLTSAKLGGLSLTNENKELLKQFERALKERIAGLDKETLRDADIYAATESLIAEWKDAGGAAAKVATALDTASQQIGQVRINPGTAMVNEKLASGEWEQRGTQVFVRGTNTRVAEMQNTSRNISGTRVKDIQYQMPDNYQRAARAANLYETAILETAQSTQRAAEQISMFPTQVEAAFGVASPSTVFARIAGFLKSGAETVIPEMKITGEQLGQAARAGIAEQLMLPGMGGGVTPPPGARMLPIVSSGTSAAQVGMLSRLKGMAGSSMGMMGLSMLAPMLIGAIPNQVGGKDLSGLKGTTQSAIGMGTMAGMTASMMGLSATGVGIPVAAGIAALGAFSTMMNNAANATKKATDEISKSFDKAKDTMLSYRTNVDIANQHQITLDLGKIKESSLNYELAQSQDKLTKTTGEAISKYAQYDTYMQKAGTDLSKQVASALQLGSAMSSLSNTWGNKIKGFLFGTSSQSNMSTLLSGKGLLSLIPGLRAKDEGYYQSQALSKVFSTIASPVTSYEQLVSPTFLKQAQDMKKALDDNKVSAGQLNEAYKTFNSTIAASDPILAAYNETLKKNKVALQDIVLIDQMYQAGFITTQKEINALAAAGQAGLDLATQGFKEYQNAIISDTNKAQAALDAAQKAADAAHAKAAKAAAGDTFTEADKAKVQSDEDLIKSIQKEIKARDDLYNAQMRNIEAQQQQMNLNAEVAKARGSGDLIALATAQQNLLIQKTKDSMALAKAQADKASQAKIDVLQAEIDKLNAKKNGKPVVISTAAEDKALADAQKNLQNAMSGLGDAAVSVRNKYLKLIEGLKSQLADKSFWDSILDAIKNWLKDFFKPPFMGVWGGLLSILKWIEDAILSFFGINTGKKDNNKDTKKSTVWDTIVNLWTEGIHLLFDPVLIVKKGAKSLWEFVKDNWKTTLETLYNFTENIPKNAKSLWTTIKEKWKTTLETLYNFEQTVVKGAKSLWTIVKDNWKSTIETVFNPPKESPLTSLFTSIKDNIISWVHSLLSIVGIGGSSGTPTPVAPTIPTPKTPVAPVIPKTVNPGGPSILLPGLGTTSTTPKLGTIVPNPPSLIPAPSTSGTFVGPIPLGTTRTSTGYTGGGAFSLALANGGIIHAASGLMVGPGGPKSDMIPAMLSNGEYVIKADAVSRYGKPFMDAINNKSYAIPASSLGVRSARDLSEAISSSTNIGGNTINVYPPKGSDTDEIAKMVIRKLETLNAKQVTARKIGVK